MNQAQFLSLLRALLKMAGASLVAKGVTDEAGLETCIGVCVGVVGLVWSHEKHRTEVTGPGKDDPNQGKLPLPMLFWILTPLLALTPGCAFSIGRHGFVIMPPVPPKNSYVRITARSIGITVAQNPATQSPELVLGFKSATYDRLPTSIGTNIFIPRVNADIEVNGGLDVSVTERLEAGK